MYHVLILNYKQIKGVFQLTEKIESYLKLETIENIVLLAGFYKTEDELKVKVLAKADEEIVELSKEVSNPFLFENQIVLRNLEFKEKTALDLVKPITHSIISGHVDGEDSYIININLLTFEKILDFAEKEIENNYLLLEKNKV